MTQQACNLRGFVYLNYQIYCRWRLKNFQCQLREMNQETNALYLAYVKFSRTTRSHSPTIPKSHNRFMIDPSRCASRVAIVRKNGREYRTISYAVRLMPYKRANVLSLHLGRHARKIFPRTGVLLFSLSLFLALSLALFLALSLCAWTQSVYLSAALHETLHATFSIY